MKKESIYKIFSRIPTLETERLILRKMLVSDKEDIYAYSCRADVTEHLTWMPHANIEYTQDYLRYIGQRYSVGDYFDWAVVEKASGRVIGSCGFTRVDYPNDAGEIGYVFHPDYCGKGYATERAAQYLESIGATSYVLNIGGNIRIIGTQPDGSGWTTRIKDPADPSQYAAWLIISDTSCVTSGDYERNFFVGTEKYHHVIDKDTLMPSTHFSSVSVFTKDSGLNSMAYGTNYAEARGLATDKNKAGIWWLRETGAKTFMLAVDRSGNITEGGYAVSDVSAGVRPIISVSTSALKK